MAFSTMSRHFYTFFVDFSYISFTFVPNKERIMIFLPDGKRLDELYAQWLIVEYKQGKKDEAEYSSSMKAGNVAQKKK